MSESPYGLIWRHGTAPVRHARLGAPAPDARHGQRGPGGRRRRRATSARARPASCCCATRCVTPGLLGDAGGDRGGHRRRLAAHRRPGHRRTPTARTRSSRGRRRCCAGAARTSRRPRSRRRSQAHPDVLEVRGRRRAVGADRGRGQGVRRPGAGPRRSDFAAAAGVDGRSGCPRSRCRGSGRHWTPCRARRPRGSPSTGCRPGTPTGRVRRRALTAGRAGPPRPADRPLRCGRTGSGSARPAPKSPRTVPELPRPNAVSTRLPASNSMQRRQALDLARLVGEALVADRDPVVAGVAAADPDADRERLGRPRRRGTVPCQIANMNGTSRSAASPDRPCARPLPCADVPGVHAVVHQLAGGVEERRHRAHVGVGDHQAGPVVGAERLEDPLHLVRSRRAAAPSSPPAAPRGTRSRPRWPARAITGRPYGAGTSPVPAGRVEGRGSSPRSCRRCGRRRRGSSSRRRPSARSQAPGSLGQREHPLGLVPHHPQDGVLALVRHRVPLAHASATFLARPSRDPAARQPGALGRR